MTVEEGGAHMVVERKGGTVLVADTAAKGFNVGEVRNQSAAVVHLLGVELHQPLIPHVMV